MTLQGMSDRMFNDIVEAAEDVQFLIVAAGGMATKTKVENVLMKRYNLDRVDAHTITNFVESRNRSVWKLIQGKAMWVSSTRDEPQPDDYQELDI